MLQRSYVLLIGIGIVIGLLLSSTAVVVAAPVDPSVTWGEPRTISATGDIPRLAVGPANRLTAAWRRCPDISSCTNELANSSDGGVTFSAPTPAGTTEQAPWDHDLVVAPDGTVHIAWTGANSMNRGPLVGRSTDGGATFGVPVQANVGDVADKPTNGGNGPTLARAGDGSLYVAWVSSQTGVCCPGAQGVFLARSTDGGATFGGVTMVDDVPLPDSQHTNFLYPTVAVGDGGKVYVAWFQGLQGGISDVRLARSLDGGSTFDPSRIVNDQPAVVEQSHLGLAMASTAAGVVHIVWTGTRASAAADPSDIYYTRSVDGVSFDAGRKLNDGAGATAEERPALATGPGGQVLASWFDRRNGSSSPALDVYSSLSLDGGLAFSPNARANPTIGSARVGLLGTAAVVDSAGVGYVAWTDVSGLQLSSSRAASPPPPMLSAGFTMTPSGGQKPLTVRFTDTSTGGPTEYTWNFGDGSVNSTEQNPSHVYLTSGTFTVTLTVKRGAVTSSSASHSITVDTPVPLRYYALGDSYSSGEGVPAFDPNTNTAKRPADFCHRSTDGAYPRIFAAALPADIGVPAKTGNSPSHFLACSGARIANVTGTESQYSTEPPQIRALTADAQLVTVSIGGNDVRGVDDRGRPVIGFGPILRSCVVDRPACNVQFSELSSTIPQLLGPLTSAYVRLKAKTGSRARVIVVNYPQIFPDFVCGGLSANETHWVRDRTHQLNGIIRQAASAAGVDVLDVESAFTDHLLCGPVGQVWANNLTPDLPRTAENESFYSFHPNRAGQNRIASLLASKVSAT
jgi:PKD repeat protein